MYARDSMTLSSMSAITRPPLFNVAAACVALGCSSAPPPEPRRAAAPEAAAWRACYAGFSPSGDPRADLEKLGDSCGSLGGMRPITAVTTGEQTADHPPDRYTFFVPEAGNCFRVFAAADRDVRDLDVLILNL